jgi:hypothetical protein
VILALMHGTLDVLSNGPRIPVVAALVPQSSRSRKVPTEHISKGKPYFARCERFRILPPLMEERNISDIVKSCL